MAARAYWQGQIRRALVSIPVEIYYAEKSGAAIKFRKIHEPSGKPINYEKVVAGIGAIDRDDIVKGYEVSMGKRSGVPHRDDELAKLSKEELRSELERSRARMNIAPSAKMAKLWDKRIHWLGSALAARD